MKRRHWILAGVGLALVVLAVWQIGAAAGGLEVTTVRDAELRLVVMGPEGVEAGTRPLVLIAHGFAGSTAIMRGFALTLAHAGYTTVLWDFEGHGTNPEPMPSSTDRSGLQGTAESALAEALARGYGDPDRVAILGHSMGSGVALAFGIDHPDTSATIAVSPTGQEVSPELPRNLLLMAGALEGRFVQNAEQRLDEAGGPGGDHAAGTAREMIVVPGVEHISIVFSPTAHAAARDWLDATFGAQPGARDYVDRRILWYGLGAVGALLLGAGLAPLVADPETATAAPRRSVWRRLAALAGGAVGATLILWLVGLAGLELNRVLGLLVGGYLLIWFGVAGVLSLLLLWVRPGAPSLRALLGGLMAFAVLWLGVGLLAEWVWLPWLLIPRRLILWPLGFVLTLPWFLAAGETVRGTGLGGRIGWWLAHSLVLVVALFLALQSSPDLGFLILILPMFPIIIGLHALGAAPHRGSWPFAVSGALFVSWMLLAVFPLQ
jgi:pimeloyl-ACP methyl ester carboxylesterase